MSQLIHMHISVSFCGFRCSFDIFWVTWHNVCPHIVQLWIDLTTRNANRYLSKVQLKSTWNVIFEKWYMFIARAKLFSNAQNVWFIFYTCILFCLWLRVCPKTSPHNTHTHTANRLSNVPTLFDCAACFCKNFFRIANIFYVYEENLPTHVAVFSLFILTKQKIIQFVKR